VHDGHAGSQIPPSAKLQTQLKGKRESGNSYKAVHSLMPKLSEAQSKHYWTIGILFLSKKGWKSAENNHIPLEQQHAHGS